MQISLRLREDNTLDVQLINEIQAIQATDAVIGRNTSQSNAIRLMLYRSLPKTIAAAPKPHKIVRKRKPIKKDETK